MNFAEATCVQLVSRGLKNLWLSESVKDQYSARALCRQCPVKTDCARYTKEISPTAGVWAGQIIGSTNTDELFIANAGRRKKVRQS